MNSIISILLFSQSKASPPTGPVALVNGAGPHNCSRICDGFHLKCLHDAIDLRTLDPTFVKEWFYLSGYSQYCNMIETARNRYDYPAFRRNHRNCYGYNHHTNQYSTCGQTGHLYVHHRSLCLCGKPQGQKSHMIQNWDKLHETGFLSSGYYQDMNDTKSQPNAEILCADQIAMPPSIRSAEQQEKLHQYALAKLGPGQKFWLFWRNRRWYDTFQYYQTPGHPNYGPHPYTNWAVGQPSGLTNCGYMNTTDGKWSLISCGTVLNVICQLDFFTWWSGSWGYFSTKLDKTLDGPVMAYKIANSLASCSHFCRSNIQCLSANFDTTTGNCSLNARHGNVHQDEMKTKFGTIYMERVLYKDFHD